MPSAKKSLLCAVPCPLSALKEAMFLALHRAGSLVARHIGQQKKIHFKGKSTINLVTWVDSAAERLIVRTLRKRFPQHNFLTEESPPLEQGSAYRWIIDPLDGTTNYAHDFPQVGISIGLEYTPKSPHPPFAKGRQGGILILCGVYDPFRRELFWAQRGRGAFLKADGRPSQRLRVSRTRTLEESILMTGFPYDRRERVDLYLSYVRAFMQRIQGIRRLGAAALDLCWVACGRIDGYWEWRLKPWDMAAGSLLVEEAGGTLSDFTGRPFSIYGDQTLATNGRIHREMLKVMKGLKR